MGTLDSFEHCTHAHSDAQICLRARCIMCACALFRIIPTGTVMQDLGKNERFSSMIL